MSDYDVFAGTSGEIPESETTEAISAPATESGVAQPLTTPDVPSVIKTAEEAQAVLAERVGHVGELAVTGTGQHAESEPVLPPARSANSIETATPRGVASKGLSRRKKEKPLKGDGRCGAYAPFGTKCKLCGKVHPA